MSARKALAEMVSAHKTNDVAKLTEAQKAFRQLETNQTVEEILRRNRNSSPDFLKEIASALFIAAEKQEGSSK